MVRKSKKKIASRRSFKSGKSGSNTGPPENATSYRGPILNRSNLSGDDRNVIAFSIRVPFQTNMGSTTFFLFTNDLNDIVALLTTAEPTGQTLPSMLGNYRSYRILGVNVRFDPASRYQTVADLPSPTAFVMPYRKGLTFGPATTGNPNSLNDFFQDPGTRNLPITDPWCMGFEYKGSSSKSPTWKAKALEDMIWKDMQDDQSLATGGVAVGYPSSADALGLGYFYVTWRIQLKDLTELDPPLYLTPARLERKPVTNQNSPVEIDITVGPTSSVTVNSQSKLNRAPKSQTMIGNGTLKRF